MAASKLFDLTGKTALVTGSSAGLGLAMARGLAEVGAAIVLNGRDETRLASAVKSFETAGHRVSSRALARGLRAADGLDPVGRSQAHIENALIPTSPACNAKANVETIDAIVDKLGR
jgi:NAD(P)-dependent dehydrogenase (short-subunit alcohol dehydrogenase family)